MFHYIRDCLVLRRGSTADNGGYLETLYVMYHFLRTAGFVNIWEIDGDDNHVSDGQMESTSPSAYWTKEPVAGGATVDYSSLNVHMGKQSLEVISSAINEGVRSIDMPNITANVLYQVRFQVLNNTGRSWNVDVQTGSVGSWTNIGSIPSSPTMQEFTGVFTSHASVVTDHVLRVIDNNYVSTPGTIYIDSVTVYKSYFEYIGVSEDHLASNIDGEIIAPDQFESTSYSFVSGAAPTGDEGKYLCVWDPTNLGNSGVYEITSVSSGIATLNLRAGGTPSLTSNGANNLKWRLIDPKNYAPYQYDPGVDRMLYCGFGLESPHTEKWRVFFRANWNTTGDCTWIDVWASGYDADFNVANGVFYNYESSTTDVRPSYSKGSNVSRYYIKGANPSVRDSSGIRLFLMTDDDKSFLSIAFRDFFGTYPDSIGGGFVGFTGADSYHTLRQSFCVFFPTNASVDGYNDYDFRTDGYSFGYIGLQHGSLGKGWMNRSTIMTLGLGGVSGDELDVGSVNYRANPFDNKHWLRKPKIARDYYGSESNNPTEKTMNNVGLWHGTIVQPWTTIDSNTYLHLNQGWYWEWWDGHEMLT